MIDAVGRRRLYISMSLGMCVVLICEAVTVAADNQRSAISAVFFIFAFEACFTWGKPNRLNISLSLPMLIGAYHRLDGYSMDIPSGNSPS
jgi:hypothetical protein